MLSINTNLSSIITQNSMKQSTNKLNEAIKKEEKNIGNYVVNYLKLQKFLFVTFVEMQMKH